MLLGLLLFVTMGIGSALAGPDGGPVPQPALIVGIIGAVGLAYANVTVPAGIYRAATQDPPENVFA